jgi:hypothetical protein
MKLSTLITVWIAVLGVGAVVAVGVSMSSSTPAPSTPSKPPQSQQPTKEMPTQEIKARPQAYAVSGNNLLVDLDNWAGKEVYLTNVRIFATDNNGALGTTSGVTFKITTRGIDKETFRRLLKNCHGIMNPECDGLSLTATPTGEKQVGWPVLINVRIGH